MKDQYFGDVNDFRKYSLLWYLSGCGAMRTGICWMLTAPDGRSDGCMLGYLSQPNDFRPLAPQVFDVLHQAVMVDKDRRVARLEETAALPNVVYHSPYLPDNKDGRFAYFQGAAASLRSADWIFFDPDNGLEVPSIALGRKGSSKFLYWHEVENTYRSGRSVLIYQHFPRKPRGPYIERLALALSERTRSPAVLSFRTNRVVFLLATHERHFDEFRVRANEVALLCGHHIKVSEHKLARSVAQAPA